METRRLAAAVHGLTAENVRLTARLGKIERTMDDFTGSISRQIDAAKAQTPRPPAAAAPVPAADAVVGSIVSPESGPLPPALSAPPETSPQTLPALVSGAPLGAPAAVASEYGVDIGSALSIQVLRARWLGIRSAHLQLFEHLQPTVTLGQSTQSKRLELRLVAGPLASAEAAKRLCAALAPYRLFCRPTIFDHGQLALR